MLYDLPETIGKYRIQRLLGEGAMGKVYEGMDDSIERRVAIKTLHTHLINNRNGEEFLERFKREAKSAARCTHPNIVTVHEYGEDDGMPFIAMEYIDGRSLHEILESNQKISLKSTLEIISQLLRAIRAAHRLGVVHRDIKTANIIVCKGNNRVKLADFGIARLADNNSMTMTGAVVGTPKYMAPEQMFGLKADERADLFSVAMVFAELLAAKPNNTRYPSSKLPIIEGLPPNNKINYSVLYPDAMIPVLKKGLASKASDRYQTVGEFASAIKDAVTRIKTAESSDNLKTRVLPASSKSDTIQPAEIDALTGMLADYIGPVARNVMREINSRHLSLSELVSAVALEIGDERQRREFTLRWERHSGERSLSQDGSLNSQDMGNLSTRGSKIRVDDNTIHQIGQDYVNYIGPFAMRMVDYYCQNSSDKEEFIQNLANEIPDQKSRDEFTKKWSMV